MDGGFRAPRPAERRVLNRSNAAYQSSDKQQVVQEESQPMHEPVQHVTASHRDAKKEKSAKPALLIAVTIIVVLLVGLGGWFVGRNMPQASAGAPIDSSKYQAVFFTNGQVYFGKLQAVNSEYMKLTSIYYLQTQANNETDSNNPQKTTTDQNSVQLIKLGDEVHGPEDEMIVSKNQVLFYENLKPDGKVAQLIDKNKANK